MHTNTKWGDHRRLRLQLNKRGLATIAAGVLLSLGGLAYALTHAKVASADPMFTSYTVQPGDNLIKRNRLGVNWHSVAEANGLQNPNSIYVGQRLVIPTDHTGVGVTRARHDPGGGVGGKAPWCGPIPQDWHPYTIKPGDTLAALTMGTGFSYWDVACRNGIGDPNRIAVGQEVYLPPKQVVGSPVVPTVTPRVRAIPTPTLSYLDKALCGEQSNIATRLVRYLFAYDDSLVLKPVPGEPYCDGVINTPASVKVRTIDEGGKRPARVRITNFYDDTFPYEDISEPVLRGYAKEVFGLSDDILNLLDYIQGSKQGISYAGLSTDRGGNYIPSLGGVLDGGLIVSRMDPGPWDVIFEFTWFTP